MKYYKLVQNNTILGAISSDNFIRYEPLTQSFLRANEQVGEYVSYRGTLYRSTWMAPITLQKPYTSIFIVEISKDEYDIYVEAIEENDEPIIDDDQPDEPVIEPVIIDPISEASIAFMKNSKINEMSRECRASIEEGIDVELPDGTHHFSLTTQDQLNLMSLSTLVDIQEFIPYHADGETCQFYTAKDMKAIIAAATTHKIYHTTYYNALKSYINSLNDIEDIANVYYGIELPTDYQSDVYQVIVDEHIV